MQEQPPAPPSQPRGILHTHRNRSALVFRLLRTRHVDRREWHGKQRRIRSARFRVGGLTALITRRRNFLRFGSGDERSERRRKGRLRPDTYGAFPLPLEDGCAHIELQVTSVGHVNAYVASIGGCLQGRRASGRTERGQGRNDAMMYFPSSGSYTAEDRVSPFVVWTFRMVSRL